MDRDISRKRKLIPFLILGIVLIVMAMIVSLMTGAAGIKGKELLDVFRYYDNTNSRHLLVMNMRLPRIITSIVVGMALAVSGALMQGMTRNPLADSGLMGISSGAGFVVAMVFGFFPGISYMKLVILTFLGAAMGASLVFGISSVVPGGDSSMKLILAGAAISIMLSALSQGIALATDVAQSVVFWTMGSVSGASWMKLGITAPFILVSTVLALMISKQVSIISMGEDVATGLGVKTGRLKFIGMTLVVFMTGTSFALAGMISFVGMLVPHFCRFVVGPDYRLIIPASAIYGAVLVVAADIGAKTLNAPGELPIGALIAFVGVPFFLYFSRRQRR